MLLNFFDWFIRKMKWSGCFETLCSITINNKTNYSQSMQWNVTNVFVKLNNQYRGLLATQLWSKW